MCLIMVLCYFFPSWLFVFQLIVALDISSHWIQMYSSLLHGETSHKTTDLNAHPIMKFYFMKVQTHTHTFTISVVHSCICIYNLIHLCMYFQPVLFTFCACNELFFAALYLQHFYSDTHGESAQKSTT